MFVIYSFATVAFEIFLDGSGHSAHLLVLFAFHSVLAERGTNNVSVSVQLKTTILYAATSMFFQSEAKPKLIQFRWQSISYIKYKRKINVVLRNMRFTALSNAMTHIIRFI